MPCIAHNSVSKRGAIQEQRISMARCNDGEGLCGFCDGFCRCERAPLALKPRDVRVCRCALIYRNF